MINSLFEERNYQLLFSNFRTKQNVLKRKLDDEFATKEWDICSDGFANSASTFPKRSNRNVLKHKTANGPQNILEPLSTFKKEIHSAFSTSPKIDCESSQDSKKISFKENGTKSKNCNFSKTPGSVFLEVQNINSSFQKNNAGIEPRPIVKLSSDFSRKLKAEIINDNSKEHKKNRRSLSINSIAQVKSCSKDRNHKVRRTENKYLELKNIQKKVDKNKLNGELSIIATCGVQSSTDTIHNTPSIPNSFREEIVRIGDLRTKLKDVPSLTTEGGLKIEDIKKYNTLSKSAKSDFLRLTKNALVNVTLSESAISNFPKWTKNAELQNVESSFTDEKGLKNPLLVKALNTETISKKTGTHHNVFENSFKKPASVRKGSIATKFPQLLNEEKTLENVPKKIKVDQGSFNFSSDLLASNIVAKGTKTSESTLPHRSKVVEKSSTFSSSSFEFPSSKTGKRPPLESNQDNESCIQGDSYRSEMSLVDFSRLLESRADGSKGSSWMQGLQDTRAGEETHHEEPAKKKLRNIVPGGFAEKMLKLQRRENSDKVIWSHKIHRNKRKVQNDSLCLVLNSTSTLEDFIIAKASLASPDELQNLSEKDGNTEDQASLNYNNVNLSFSKLNMDGFRETYKSEIVFILFKKKIFTKLQLKVKDVFNIYQPWQTIHVKSIPYPVILCAYFIDKVSFLNSGIASEESIHITGLRETTLLLKHNIPLETATQGDLLFFKRDEFVTFSERIHRVWKKEFKVRDPNGSALESKYIRASVLLQIKEGTFHELRILPDSIPNHWYDMMREGKCYRFCNLSVTQRTPLKKDKSLRHILEAFQLQNGSHMHQEFCYQLMFGSSSKSPEEINEEGFPDYCPIKVEPLQNILKTLTYCRFTCISKVLLQHRDVFYISDESLLVTSSIKYVQVQFLSTAEVRPSLNGCVVLVKEALVEEGTLVIDNYSQIILLTETSQAYQDLSMEDKSRVQNQKDVCLENVIPSLHMFSKVEDLVYVNGVVSGVDESTAYTWLHCSFCLQENLVQDTNLIIYCEDCSRVVPCPVLNVKLEVAVCCPQLPSAVVNVQLLSTTIKKILQIPESKYQPQCSVCDVLNKQIGPLCCSVQNCDTICDKVVYHLSEIDTS